MGFSIAEGPDVESDFYNFTELNFPPGHPAREMHDTFFFPHRPDGSRKLLRTHTSPVQVRTMLKQPAADPRASCPGRTYRCDSDQTHTPMFHQVEGLVIDRKRPYGPSQGLPERILQDLLRDRPIVPMRFRPSFFPFTEPSAEVDIGCSRKGGEMRFGEGDDWLEILGCGMVHPNVLRNCGIDPDELPGLRLGHGHRAHRHAEIRHARSAHLLRSRSALAAALRLSVPLDLPTLAGGRADARFQESSQ